MKKLIFLCVLASGVLAATAQWEWRNPAPFGWSFSSIQFLNPQTGFICGEGGKLYKTVDAGVTWIEIPTGLADHLQRVCFSDENTGFLINSEGRLLKSIDGGYSWSLVDLPDVYVNDIQFLTPEKGFVCGQTGVLFRTGDGGVTWSQIAFSQWVIPWDINAIHFADQLNGYAVGDVGVKHRTTDGGLTWTTTWEDPMLNQTDVFFLNPSTGYISGVSGLFMVTQNGGAHWDYFASSHSVSELYFVDLVTGYALADGALVKTTNGGHSWIPVGMNGCRSYCFTGAQTVHAAGAYGNIFKSFDAGATYVNYTQAITRSSLEDIHFCDDMHGFAVSYDMTIDEFAEIAEIIRTTDGGENWEIVDTLQGIRPTGIYFVSPQEGYISSAGGKVYKTNNGGFSWSELTTGTDACITGMAFTGSNVGYFATEYNPSAVFKTYNAGQIWEVVLDLNGSGAVRDIQFINETTGFALTSGSILRTDDAGATWSEYSISDTALLLDVFFIDETTGFAGGFQGDVYKTIDGGITWEYKPLPEYSTVMEFFFTDSNTGYAAADGASFYQTGNGGNTWTKLWYMPSCWFNGVWFTNDFTGFICGGGGTIMKTSNGGAVPASSGWAPVVNPLVFPNPASTTIGLSLPAEEMPATVSIYSFCGQELRRLILVNTTETIDVSLLSPGSYFVKVTTVSGMIRQGIFIRL